jgi:hypothetical protein
MIISLFNHIACLALFRLSMLFISPLQPGTLPEVPAWDRLMQEEIIVEKIEDSLGLPGIRAMFTISASRDELWEMLTDYGNFPKIYGGIDSLSVLAEDEYSAKVEIYQTAFIRKLCYILQRNYVRRGYKLTWERISGDLKYIQGSWEILDSPDHNTKLVIYTSFFKYGGLVPTRLARNWAIPEVCGMAENARNWVRQMRSVPPE